MNTTRRDDVRGTETRFQSERVTQHKGMWFFYTREGREGPFYSETEATFKLEGYIRLVAFGLLPRASTLSLQPVEVEQNLARRHKVA